MVSSRNLGGCRFGIELAGKTSLSPESGEYRLGMKFRTNMTLKKSALILLFALASVPASPAQSLDIVITNGHIVDGTGSPWYSGDSGIREGRIVAIGNLAEAPRKRTKIGRASCRERVRCSVSAG